MDSMEGHPRFRYGETPDGTVVTVTGSSRLANALVSVIAFCAVAAFLVLSDYFGGAVALVEDAREIGVRPPLSAFAAMAAGGAMLFLTAYRALRRVFGVEVLAIGSGKVSYVSSLFGFGKRRSWPLREIDSIRALSQEILSGTAKATYRAMGIRSAVRFDHEKKTITLFKDIDEASAKSISGILTQAQEKERTSI